MWHGAPPRMVLQLTTKLNIFKFHMLIKLILFEFEVTYHGLVSSVLTEMHCDD